MLFTPIATECHRRRVGDTVPCLKEGVSFIHPLFQASGCGSRRRGLLQGNRKSESTHFVGLRARGDGALQEARASDTPAPGCTAAVAPFRAWRGSRLAVAGAPARTSAYC